MVSLVVVAMVSTIIPLLTCWSSFNVFVLFFSLLVLSELFCTFLPGVAHFHVRVCMCCCAAPREGACCLGKAACTLADACRFPLRKEFLPYQRNRRRSTNTNETNHNEHDAVLLLLFFTSANTAQPFKAAAASLRSSLCPAAKSRKRRKKQSEVDGVKRAWSERCEEAAHTFFLTHTAAALRPSP
jgi:hypothetical protein